MSLPHLTKPLGKFGDGPMLGVLKEALVRILSTFIGCLYAIIAWQPSKTSFNLADFVLVKSSLIWWMVLSWLKLLTNVEVKIRDLSIHFGGGAGPCIFALCIPLLMTLAG